MPGIRAELAAFLTAVIAGVIIRLVYHWLESFRKMKKHKNVVTGIEDTIFWIGTAIYLFVQIYYTSDGSIRWYFVLGVVFGVVITTRILRKMKKVTKKIYELYSGQSIAKKKKKRYYYK